MTASSQDPPGALPPESLHDPRPLQTAVASYAAAIPAPAGPVPPAQAATGVISAAMEQGHTAPAEIADAEEAAGILFDPQRAKDIAAAAYEQGRAECAAELTEIRGQLAALAGARRQLAAVARLIEGRPVGDFLPAAEVARAVEYGSTSLDAYPMTLTWTAKYGVDLPGPGDASELAVIRCRSSHGQAADLIVEGDDRRALAGLLDLEVRDIHATCPTDGCGTVDDYDASDPALFGWSRLRIAALGDEARWYCSDRCVFDALARAGHDLAEADRQAAVDPAQQGHAPAEGGAW